MSILAPQLILNKAVATEKAVFGQFKKLDSNYKSKARSIFLNLKDKKNSSLRERVISGEISPERLATMTNAELASKDLQQEMKAIQEENLKNSMVGKPEKSVTDQLTCSRCRQKRVSYTQAQTRSADEPLTTVSCAS
jgi:transcription elongation factor S-II